MPFIPNPWILLGSFIIALGLFLSGLSIGIRWQKGREAANVAAVQKQTIDDANRTVRIETERALASAKAEADARVRAAGIRRKGEIDAILKARPSCNRDSDSLRLLVESINSANGTEAATNKLSEPVHVDP